MSIEKQVTSGTVYAGQDVTYEIEVTNTGQVRVNNVEVWDYIPPHTTFVSASDEGAYADDIVTWPAWDHLNSGATLTYQLTLHVSDEVPDGYPMTNRAYAQADEMSYFVLTEHRVPVSNPPRLQISKRALDAWARAGEVLHYEIIVSNQGSGSAYNVQVWDEIPQITEGVGSTPPGDYDPDTQTVTWPVVDTLPPGEELVFTPGVRVPSDAVHNRHITNRAYAQADGVDAVSASVNSTIWNPPDLTVAHIEVNQAVQDRENSVPLVARKPAVARVYVDIGDQGETVGHVTGILEVWRDGTLVDTITPSNPRGEIAAPDDPDPENINDSLNFILDSDYLFDDLVLEVTLNPDHTVTETDYNNNTETLHATFTSRRSVRIAYVPIHYDPPGYVGPNDPSDRIAQGDQFYKWIYPLAPRRVDYFPLPPITWTQDVNIDYTPLILEVGDLWFDCDCDHVYGWLPSGVFGSNGLGYKPGYTAYGNDTDDRWRRTFAHELGHNMDADHPRGQGGDPNAPDTLEEGEEYGFNVSSREVKSRRPDGGMLRDVMYAAEIEPNAWVTPYFWNMMFDAYGPPTQAVAESAPGEYLLASGIVHRQGGGSLRPLFRVTRTTAPPPEGTDYCLRQEDAIGQSLALHCFDVGFVGDDAPTSPDTMPFHIIVPWADGTARVVLLQDTTVLDERVASPSSPTVQVLSPNGGESWSGAQAVSWTGSDPDGDTLVYSVLYSHDGGASWQPVSPRITTTTYLLDTSQVGGGDQCLIGVRVSDGLNTAHDESDAVFQVATKPPQAFIYAPEEDEASLTKGRRASFAGRGHDLEDGLLPAGSLSWSSSLDGFLGTGYSLVTADLSLGTHQITLTATDSQSLTGTTDITIQVSPPPSTACVERLHNGGFETGNLAGWHRGGTPRAVVINSQPYTGAYSLLLGNPAELPEQPSLSFVRQYVRVPADASEATLTFWYKVHSSDPRVDYDWFGAYILDPQGDRAHQVVRFAANTDWEQAIYDLTEFRGQVIGIGFFVRNDGQSGSTWAFVDDVSVCTDGAAPPAPELDACWLPGDQPDYAPAGLPDFGQRQGQWLVPDTEQWSHDGPAAMANLLWWQDSAEEPGATPPPTFSDGYPLVKSYGVWDDHDPQNVPPLVADLATRFNTNGEHPGTDLDDLVAGLNAYLAEKGLADDYTLTLRKSPSFDWVREEAKQNRQALLLLGFWELQPTGWRRLGGHYVAVAGASCSGDWIAFSDPFRNYAEAGWPGRVAPTTPHGHPAEPPDAVHNDAAYLSHDIYGIMRTTAGWGPQGYARWYQDVDNFAGLNFVPALEPVRAAAYLGGEILTLADYALVLAPQSELVTLKLSPTTSHVRAGQSFLVEMEVLDGAQDADAVSAYLNFDPAVLTVVDEEGSPATQITPGAALPTVTTNSVNNTTGWINFVAGGDPTDGRFTVATVRFKAITTTMSSPLTWSMAGLRQSDLSSSGDSVLGSLQDGSVTVGPGAFLVGQAEMQGRSTPPDASWSVPLLLTLSRPGERGAAYVYGTMSNESGVFPVPGVAAPGNYRVRVKGLHTLRNLSPTALSGGANTADMETLLEGDAINDNRVDVRDVSAVAAAYGKSQGQAGFDPRADFNEDDTINDADVSLLQANLGRRGDVLVGTHVSRFTLHEITPETFNLELTTSPQAGAVSLRLVPTSTVAAVGDVIVLDVVADAGAQPVDAAELHLDFDPAALQVVDAAGDPATEIEPSIALPTVFLNSVDPARGWADYLASSLGSSPASGEFTVARLRFKVLQAGGTWVRFSFSDWRLTDMTYQAQSVLGSVEAAQVQATAKYDIYLPVILKQYNP